MNTTLALEYTRTGPVLSRTRSLEGVESDMQACLLNMTCAKGTDFTFPERGTDLLRSAVAGGLIERGSAQHVANFAVEDTKLFVLGDVAGEARRAQNLEAEAAIGANNRLLLRIKLTDASDQQLALTTALWLG